MKSMIRASLYRNVRYSCTRLRWTRRFYNTEDEKMLHDLQDLERDMKSVIGSLSREELVDTTLSSLNIDDSNPKSDEMQQKLTRYFELMELEDRNAKPSEEIGTLTEEIFAELEPALKTFLDENMAKENEVADEQGEQNIHVQEDVHSDVEQYVSRLRRSVQDELYTQRSVAEMTFKDASDAFDVLLRQMQWRAMHDNDEGPRLHWRDEWFGDPPVAHVCMSVRDNAPHSTATMGVCSVFFTDRLLRIARVPVDGNDHSIVPDVVWLTLPPPWLVALQRVKYTPLLDELNNTVKVLEAQWKHLHPRKKQ